jgi:hypothetical protein
MRQNLLHKSPSVSTTKCPFLVRAMSRRVGYRGSCGGRSMLRGSIGVVGVAVTGTQPVLRLALAKALVETSVLDDFNLSGSSSGSLSDSRKDGPVFNPDGSKSLDNSLGLKNVVSIVSKPKLVSLHCR